MEQLIQIRKDGNDKSAVSAKELFLALGMDKSNFSKWYNRNIIKNKFAIEGEDWVTGMNANVPTEISDFALTIDFAKRLAMLTRTTKGEEVRNYFIACEAQLKQPLVQSTTPTNYIEALKQLIAKEEEKEQLLLQAAEDKPKVEFYEAVTGSKDAVQMSEVAKVLNMGIGRNKLFEILRNKKVLMKDNIPYQSFCDSEYFRVIEQKYNTPNGEVHINTKTVVYQKGVEYIRKIVATSQS